MSKAQQMNLEQKIVSFEQKRAILDRIIQETDVDNVGEFIQRYTNQERAKAELFARVTSKSSASTDSQAFSTVSGIVFTLHYRFRWSDSALRDTIAQLEDEITRLSGMGDVGSIVHLEQPTGMPFTRFRLNHPP